MQSEANVREAPTIIYDCVEQAARQGLLIDDRIHRVLPEGPWLRQVKRRTGLSNLFVYYHEIHGTYVVAGWAIPPGKYGWGIALELESFEGHPDHLETGAPSIEWMIQRTTYDENPYVSMQRHLRNCHQRKAKLSEQVREQTAELVRSVM